MNPAKTIKITGTFPNLSSETCLGELTPVQGSGWSLGLTVTPLFSLEEEC